jgi:manganese-transporting P-type ATPase
LNHHSTAETAPTRLNNHNPSGPAAEERVVPADCLLLAGTAIVEEAVLTGESTPQWKVHIGDTDPTAHLNMKLDK